MSFNVWITIHDLEAFNETLKPLRNDPITTEEELKVYVKGRGKIFNNTYRSMLAENQENFPDYFGDSLATDLALFFSEKQRNYDIENSLFNASEVTMIFDELAGLRRLVGVGNGDFELPGLVEISDTPRALWSPSGLKELKPLLDCISTERQLIEFKGNVGEKIDAEKINEFLDVFSHWSVFLKAVDDVISNNELLLISTG